MNDNYNPEWVIAALEDLREFCAHCGLARSFVSIEHAVQTVKEEIASAREASAEFLYREAMPVTLRRKN